MCVNNRLAIIVVATPCRGLRPLRFVDHDNNTCDIKSAPSIRIGRPERCQSLANGKASGVAFQASSKCFAILYHDTKYECASRVKYDPMVFQAMA